MTYYDLSHPDGRDFFSDRREVEGFTMRAVYCPVCDSSMDWEVASDGSTQQYCSQCGYAEEV